MKACGSTKGPPWDTTAPLSDRVAPEDWPPPPEQHRLQRRNITVAAIIHTRTPPAAIPAITGTPRWIPTVCVGKAVFNTGVGNADTEDVPKGLVLPDPEEGLTSGYPNCINGFKKIQSSRRNVRQTFLLLSE